MEQVGYQIVHAIAGRIRLRVPWLETDPQATSNYQRLVEALNGVKAVRINPLAQSIVVEYYPRGISLSNMQETLIAVMQQVKLTPPAAAPTVESESVKSESVSDPVSVESPTEQSSEPSPAPMPQPQSKQSIVSEIPSPWDEEPSDPNSTSLSEPTPEEPLNHTIGETMMSDSVCSTASLAKRLKVTSQAITRRRTKSDFGQWTQAQDPDGIAWNYHEHDRLFRPISTVQEMK